jgi:hypothetical protein
MSEAHQTAVAVFRSRQGLAANAESSAVWWATLGTFVVPLPNFHWRRAIIGQHDLHHLMTGYGLDVQGELCIAAWETGVRCYASRWARLLCGFLFGLGMISQPRATWRAFQQGRASYDIYAEMLRRDPVTRSQDHA